MARFLASVTVALQGDILDPAGEATAEALRRMGYPVNDVRIGRQVTLTLDAPDEVRARQLTQQMADALLANPIMETYQVKMEGLCKLES